MKPLELDFGNDDAKINTEAALMGLLALISTLIGFMINQIFGLTNLGSIPLITSVTVYMSYIMVRSRHG